MVLEWLWGSKPSNSPADAVKNLDPSLREVLAKQRSEPSRASPIDNTDKDHSYVDELKKAGSWHEAATAPESSSSTTPQVPPQSLYQDGRYAHLWKNYQPQHLIDARGENETDKLRRLSDDLEYRKAQLGAAALENCVLEQLAEWDCLKNGTLAQKTMMCRPQKKKFNRCYDMQLKFLKALGYFEAIGDDRRMEAIQMHSDKLWQRLSEQDELIQKAKDEGTEIPTFENVLSPRVVGSVGGSLSVLKAPGSHASSIPEPLREEFETRTRGMAPDEIKMEEAVFLAEMETRRRTARMGLEALREEGEARRRRFEAGVPTLNDRIKRWSGWDEWDSKFPKPNDLKAKERNKVEAKG